MTSTRSTAIVLGCLALVACQTKTKPGPAEAPPAESAKPTEQAASMPASQPVVRTIDMAYVDSRCAGASPCTCKGPLDTGRPELMKIGVDEKALAEGTPCLLGDFDGNGHKDGAFLGAGFGDKAVPVRVLLYDEGGLSALRSLPRNVSSLGILRDKDGKETLVEPGARLRFDYASGAFVANRM